VKKSVLVAVAVALALCAGCQQKKKVVAVPLPPKPAELKAVPFVAPADSALTEGQMKSWISCNRSLDSLTAVYADSFKSEDPSLRLKYQHAYSEARNILCLHNGLRGVYDEYHWITNALAYPKNRAVAGRFNVTVH
jgi:hypothetical protein